MSENESCLVPLRWTFRGPSHSATPNRPTPASPSSLPTWTPRERSRWRRSSAKWVFFKWEWKIHSSIVVFVRLSANICTRPSAEISFQVVDIESQNKTKPKKKKKWMPWEAMGNTWFRELVLEAVRHLLASVMWLVFSCWSLLAQVVKVSTIMNWFG